MLDITSDAMVCFWLATRGGSKAEVPLNQPNHFQVYSLSSPSTIIQGYGSPTREHNPPPKKKRKQAGNLDPSAEVIALSPLALSLPEVCHLGFQRDQNLQLHRRVHTCHGI
ncbi:hypothetical protein Q3G72_015453 [Acer saccharum]|nr:hypothetical protein Q3G72_015453 [Acer saccharum]